MRAIPAAGLLLLAGCTTLPDVREVAAHGVVMAPDRATATATARLWDDVAPRLEALDAGLELRPVQVWVFDDVEGESIYGGFDQRGGRILLDAHRRHPTVTLAHELVHAYEPAAWERLPAVVREGLADWLASRAVPAAAAEIRASRAVSLASYATGGLPLPVTEGGRVRMVKMGVPVDTALTPLEALRIPHGHIRGAGDGQTLKALYGMGLLIVTRTGPARLTELSRAAAAHGPGLVTPQAILAAARLPAEAATWLAAIEGLVAAPTEQAEVRRVLGLAPLAASDPAGADAGMRD